MPHVTHLPNQTRWGDNEINEEKNKTKQKEPLCCVVFYKLMAILKTLPGTENILGHLQNEQSTFTRKHLPRIPHQVIRINSSIRCTYQIKVNG